MTKVLADISKNGEHIFTDIISGGETNGLPVGGTADQVLAKIDGTDYNAEWVDAGSGYILPTASASVKGGVKVGDRLSIVSEVLSADVQTDNNFTTTLKNKLDGIAVGAEVNVQADYTQATNTADDYIKNKPNLSVYELLSNKVTSISGSSTDTQYGSAKLLYDKLALKEPNLPATPTDPDNKFLNGNRQWAEIALGTSGYSSNNYFTNLDSDISGYKQISYTNDLTETELTINVNNNEVLARTYLYTLPLGVTIIDAGTWHVDYRTKVNNTAGNTQLKFEAFVRHSNGTETTLFSFYTPTIENTDYQTLKLDSTQPNFTVLATDRLGVRIYVKTTVAAAIIVYTIIGDGNASYFTTPLALRHSQLRALNEDVNNVHVTSTEKSDITHTNRSSLDLVSGTNTGDQIITVGTTTTLVSTEEASVENSGTTTAPILDFSIPRGLSGVVYSATEPLEDDVIWIDPTAEGQPFYRATQEQSEAGIDNNSYMTSLRTKQAIDSYDIITKSSVSPTSITDIWVGTQAQYDAIDTKSTTTLYCISA